MDRQADIDGIKRALDAAKAELTGSPRVVGVQFDLREDSTGDPAVFVIAVLDESTSDEEWTSERLDPIADGLRKAVWRTGIDCWVHVRFARPSDISEAA